MLTDQSTGCDRGSRCPVLHARELPAILAPGSDEAAEKEEKEKEKELAAKVRNRGRHSGYGKPCFDYLLDRGSVLRLFCFRFFVSPHLQFFCRVSQMLD